MSLAFKMLVLILTVLASRMVSCVSLDDVHSSLKTFKTIHDRNTRDKTLRVALDSIRRRRQDYSRNSGYGPYSLPIYAAEYYKRFGPVIKKQEEQVMNVPLGYTQLETNDYLEEPSNSELFSAVLANKLSQLVQQIDEMDANIEEEEDPLRVINIKKKRSALRNKDIHTLNPKVKVNEDSKNKKPLSATNSISEQKNINYKSANSKSYATVKSPALKGKDTKKITKRKSTRRVLEDHFNIEGKKKTNKSENKSESKNSNKNETPKASQVLNSTKSLSLSQSSSHPSLNSQKEVKRSITKRKATSAANGMSTEKSVIPNTPKQTDKKVMAELSNILSEDQTDKQINSKNNKNNNTKSHSIEQKSNVIKRKSKRSDSNIDVSNSDVSNSDVSNSEVSNSEVSNSEVTNSDITNSDFAISDEEIESENEELFNPNENKVIEQIKSESESQKSDNELPANKEDFDEWLRREYYSNIAKTLATMRKKRSDENDDPLPLDDDDDDDIGFSSLEDTIDENENLIAIDDNENNDDESNNNDTVKLAKVIDDDTDDDYVVATEDDDDSSIDGEIVVKNDVNEKNKKKKRKRSVSPYFGKIEDNDDDQNNNDINKESESFSHVDDRLKTIEDALITEALDIIKDIAEKGSQTDSDRNKIENRLDAAYDLEDMRASLNNLHNTMEKMEREPQSDDNSNDSDRDIELAIPIINNEYSTQKRKRTGDPESYCFALDLMSNDCSPVKDMIPEGKHNKLFIGACNWHQVCYTCGEVFGLLSSDCDFGFLEGSRLACDGSASCESFARIILSPLRQSRVFYKRNVPSVCYQYQCVRDFLIGKQQNYR